ncbi:MAG: hypothetical protein AAFQ65_12185 [Myxococcota bacterium]
MLAIEPRPTVLGFLLMLISGGAACFVSGPDITCAEGSGVDDGICVVGARCGVGTMLSEAGGMCVPVLSCDTNTGADADFECQPGAEVCPPGTSLSEAEGRCVQQDVPVQCGEGTEALDGDCVRSCDAVNETRSSDQASCVPAASARFLNASPEPRLNPVDFVILPENELFRTTANRSAGAQITFGGVTELGEVRTEFSPLAGGGEGDDGLDVGLGTTLDVGSAYLVSLAGIESSSSASPRLLVTAFAGGLTLIHAVADVTQVARPSIAAPVDTLAFGQAGASFPLPSDNQIALELDGTAATFRFDAGSTGFVVATGFLTPVGEQPDLTLVFVPRDGAARVLDRLN